jgi:beta-glucanase (GH16 family)
MAALRRRTTSPRRRRARRALGGTAALAGVAALLTAGGWTPPAESAVRTAVPSTSATSSSTPYCGPQQLKVDGSPWTCTFSDNFSGSTLDTTKWSVGTTAQTGFSVGQTCFQSGDVTVSGGALNLTSRDSGTPYTCDSPAGAFTTRYSGGHVATAGKFSQTYGRFDVRARYPLDGPGLHGGFWLYPAAQTYGPWPASGEIDVSEWWSGVPTTVLPTLHYTTSTFLDDSGWLCQVVDPTAWHVYSVVWAPVLMQFSIDGTPCFTRQWTPDAPLVAPQPFDKPFNMVLTFGADGDGMPTNIVTPLTTFPATYQVDYVRAWR